MPRWATDATQLIGNTPLVRLNKSLPAARPYWLSWSHSSRATA